VQIFVLVKGEYLKEGMYLEANIEGQEKLNALKIPRNLLVDDTKMYVIDADSSLALQTVNVVHKSRGFVIVQGVHNGDLVLSKPIPGSYAGMKVIVKTQD